MISLRASLLRICNFPNCFKFPIPAELFKASFESINNVPVTRIKFDKEFDSINNPDTNVFLQEVTKKITMTFSEKDHPGIVISTNKNGPGIKIVNLNKKDLCYRSGLRIGDVIIFLNSIPCYSHHQSIEIIKHANVHKKELICELLIIKK